MTWQKWNIVFSHDPDMLRGWQKLIHDPLGSMVEHSFVLMVKLADLGLSDFPGSKIHRIQQQTQNLRSKTHNVHPHFMSPRIQDPQDPIDIFLLLDPGSTRSNIFNFQDPRSTG